MIKQRTIDISVGLFMLAGLMALVFMVLKVSGISSIVSDSGYAVEADFADIGGLRVRAPVTIAGVRIGEVTDIELQPERLNARVKMKLNSKTHIPYDDVSARILTEGLIGSNYISIIPGFDDSSDKKHPFLRSGDVIAKTQEAVILENLIGQLLFNIKK